MGAVLHEYNIVEKFLKGYRNREDITTLPPSVLVQGSQNVLTNVSQRIGIRKGYTLDGQRDTSRNPITAWYDWHRHIGTTAHLRAGGDFAGGAGKLQFRYVASAGDKWAGNTFTQGQVYWIDLVTGFSESSFNFADFWDDNTEKKDFLLFVNNTPRIWEWSGGVTTLKSTSYADGSISSYIGPGAVATVTGGGGGGYALGDSLALQNSGDGNLTLSVSTTNPGGVITLLTVANAGNGYAIGNSGLIMGNSVLGSEADAAVATLVTNPGTGYQVGDTVTVVGGNNNAQFKVLSVTAAGGISSMRMLNPGTGYTAIVCSFTGGHGTGAQISISAVSKGYIETNGTTSWAQLGFYTNNTRQVNINGHLYSYTAGEGTTFIMGLDADPTAEPVNSVIFQQVRYTLNANMKGIPNSLNNNLIAQLSGDRIFIGGSDFQMVFASKVANYKDYSFSTPRKVGEGCQFPLSGVPTAFIPQENTLYISSGKSNWYQVQFTLSSDLANEIVSAQQLKTTGQQAAQSQALTTKIKNYVAFISYEPIVNLLGIDPNILQEPRMSDIGNSIVNDINSYDFTGASIAYSPGTPSQPGQYIFLAVPKDSVVRIYNMTDSSSQYWEAPQVMPIAGFSIVDGEVYGHSSRSSNTYKLFDGYNDDGYAVKAVAAFAFNGLGEYTVRKSSNAEYVEGYITSNTTLNMNLIRDLNGLSPSYTGQISGSDKQIIPNPVDTASLGKNSLGKSPLGLNETFSTPTSLPPKFRVIKTYNRVEYFEEQAVFWSEGIDQVWELLRFGTNASPSSNEPADIKE